MKTSLLPEICLSTMSRDQYYTLRSDCPLAPVCGTREFTDADGICYKSQGQGQY